ncbi:MAG TPA: MbnP family protein [Chitinophagaceae bacterium]|nr:MbnP family protein [Chitinophagaceae bacterium]
MKLFFSIAIALTFFSCQKSIDISPDIPADHELTLQFFSFADNQRLELGDVYTNIFGEDYSVANFKFYFCQVELLNTDSGTSYRMNDGEYFLVNFADSSSTRINFEALSGKYNAISFLLGVDSVRNVSGAQTGALDPANGMFWTWNTGYIMAKLEGSSPVSNQPNQTFEYHIGGFSGPDNVVRRITIPFAAVQLQKDKTTEMVINVNANSWFHTPNNISIATTPVVTTPGALANKIATNYSNMFNIVNIVSH